MSYNLITHHNAAAFTIGREGHSIRFIIIHHWDDPARAPRFEGVLAWFKNPAAGTSAHYVVEAGRVACMVAESDTAYHAGNWTMNLESIGIECNPRCSTEDLATVKELVADLLTRYPGAQIIGHQDVIATGCPGRYYAHLDYLRGARPAPASASPARLSEDGIIGSATIRALQKRLGTPQDGVISSQAASNMEYVPAAGNGWEWVPDTAAQGSTLVAALQRLLGTDPDGIIGRVTITALQKRLGVTQDGYAGAQTAKALQNRLNQGKF